MKKALLVLVSASTATLFGAAALIACGGDDATSKVPTDAGTDSTTTAADAHVDSSTSLDAGADATSAADGSSGADSGRGTDAGDAATTGDGGIPPVPTLGVQIDRFGRPAINTALNHGFDSNATTAGAAKDAYNADSDAGAWAATYTAEFEKNLAILDGLDTVCGNQAFAGPLDAGPARYATLAGVLADDRLWVNTAATSCTQYLGVELIATGVLANDGGADGGPTNECGGRKLPYDVIQTTYSAAAAGALSGVGSGVGAVPGKVNGTTFPFLAPPL